ncbi:uroporphyrinogen-III synthase [Sphingomonas sp.]|uniref:uroporphyrinogen-III synthase n=1 Tax=Sphingomonas sp. TaxID=28214 RepID=UPI003AFFD7FA
MHDALVLRPEPGNARTTARLTAAGVTVRSCPLFAVTPVAWQVPDPAAYDALLFTSANAVRQGGAGLAGLTGLPVIAVGEATAAAARDAGFVVSLTGSDDATAVIAAAPDRLLHLAGRDRRALTGIDAITVYASDALAMPAGATRAWAGCVALLHSERAAGRFADLAARDDADRAAIAIAALSPAVATAAGDGWATCAVAAAPTDAALIAVAVALIDRADTPADKRPR